MVPNYSKPDDLEKFNALVGTQHGQMTVECYKYTVRKVLFMKRPFRWWMGLEKF